MAETTIIYPETSPLALDFYTTNVGGLVIAPVNVAAFVDGSGYSTPVTAVAPLPVTISGSGGGITTVTGIITNPTSILTRPANTDAYAQNDLIASSTTAGSVVVPSVTVARVAAGNFMIRRVRLSTNKTSDWDGVTVTVRMWTAAPTYTNGDNGAYAVATGAAGFLGAFAIALSQWADGAVGIGAPTVGGELGVALASGSVVYWDLQYTGSAALTPASGQTFTLTVEDYQN